MDTLAHLGTLPVDTLLLVVDTLLLLLLVVDILPLAVDTLLGTLPEVQHVHDCQFLFDY